ncbi:MAG: phenylacetate--CoA ligase family protein [Planctomycetes bacterium]|nr:phenylacetate--CoA ligase family protein [Planctomycetota bacterium]
MPEIEFSLRDFCHPVAIARLGRAFTRHLHEPHEAWQAWRDARLCETVAAAGRCPFWRERFAAAGVAPSNLRTAADLRRLPLLRKEEVRAGGAALHADDAERHRARPSFTSGTTGHPVPFLVDRHARVLEFVYYRRHWGLAGFRLGQRFAQLNAQHFLRRGMGERVAHWQPHLRRLMLNSAALRRDNVHDYLAAMRAHRIRFLKGLASPLFWLAELATERQLPVPPLAALFSTGENLVPARRARIEHAFAARVLDSYGLLEQAASIFECPAGGQHVNSDYALHEFVPTEFRTPDGSPLHAIVGTTLHNRSMPLLRYDVGDLVELLPAGARCRCAIPLPLVKAVHGRTEDAVVTPDGRCVTALFVVPDEVPGVAGVQFLQDDPLHLRIRVVPTAEFDAAREREFIAFAQQLVGPALRITLERVAADGLKRGPTGKVPLVLSVVPRARAVAGGSEFAP